MLIKINTSPASKHQVSQYENSPKDIDRLSGTTSCKKSLIKQSSHTQSGIFSVKANLKKAIPAFLLSCKVHQLDEEVFSPNEIEILYKARVVDNHSKTEEIQFKRFKEYCA